VDLEDRAVASRFRDGGLRHRAHLLFRA
jgi:hypothetical protein